MFREKKPIVGLFIGIASLGLLYPKIDVSGQQEISESQPEVSVSQTFDTSQESSMSQPVVSETTRESESIPESVTELVLEEILNVETEGETGGILALLAAEQDLGQPLDLSVQPRAIDVRNDVIRRFRPTYPHGYINHPMVNPDLTQEQVWVNHVMHYSLRHLFLTVIRERIPPLGYEIGSETHISIPLALRFENSPEYVREHLSRTNGIDFMIVSAHDMVQNGQKQVWTNGNWELGLGTPANEPNRRSRILNMVSSGKKRTPDGAYEVDVAVRGIFLDITVKRLRAERSPQRHFEDLAIRYEANYNLYDWRGAAQGWGVNISQPNNFTLGVFNPRISFELEDPPALRLGRSNRSGDLELNQPFNENAADYVTIQSGMRLGRKSYRFVNIPDTSRLGRQTVQVEVVDQYEIYRHVQRINVEFEVRNTLTAVAVPQTLKLGQPLRTIDLKSLVENVEVNGESIPAQDYHVRLINTPNMTVVNEQTWRVGVSYRNQASSEIEVAVPVSLTWGNAISIKGYSRQDVMAIALHQETDGTYLINSNVGGSRYVQGSIHSRYPNEYFSVTLSGFTNNSGIVNYPNNFQERYHFTKNGTDLRSSASLDFEEQKVAIGNVIAIYHAEAPNISNMIDLYTDGNLNSAYGSSHRNNILYFEVTAKGFVPLVFNQLRPEVLAADIFEDWGDLNNRRHEFFDNQTLIPSLNLRMITYPRTSIAGVNDGQIMARETLNSGRQIDYLYPVQVSVQRGPLTLNVPERLEFEDYRITNSPQEIRRKQSNWTINVRDRRGDDPQSLWRVMAKVRPSRTGISDYYIFRQGNQQTPLNGDAVEIFQSEEGERRLEISTNIRWSGRDGIHIGFPALPSLTANKSYQDIIEWQLIEGP